MSLGACKLNTEIHSSSSTPGGTDSQIISDNFQIADGKTTTNTNEINLDITKDGSSFVIERDRPSCQNSQNWQSSDSTYSLLGDLNKTVQFFVKVKDVSGKTTSCVEFPVTVDVSPPKVISVSHFNGVTLPRSGVTDGPQLPTPVIEDNLSGFSHFEVGISKVNLSPGFPGVEDEVVPFTVWTPGTPAPGLGVLSGTDELIYKIRAVDQAGNHSSIFYSETWSHDATLHAVMEENRLTENLLFSMVYQDYNGDGLVDLFMGGGSDSSATIFYYENDGAGGFLSSQQWQGFGILPISDGEDFNGDGRNDMLTKDNFVLFFDNGYFAKIAHKQDMDRYHYVDFDNDSDKDLVYEKDNVFFFAERDGFAFTKSQLFDSGINVSVFEVLDVNEDGTLDIATVNATTDEVGWFDGANSWSYNAIRVVPGATYFQFGEFDSAAGLDVFCWDANDGDNFFHSGDGAGNFGAGVATFNADNSSMKVVDLNGDAYDDLIVTSPTLGHRGMTSDGDGTFTTIFTENASSGFLTKAVDFDGDGNIDLIDREKIFINNGSNAFPSGDVIDLGNNIIEKADPYGHAGSAVADIDKDGFDDIVVSNGYGAVLMLNDGSGNFTAAKVLPQEGASSVRIVDFDGDNELDIVVGGTSLYLYINDGSESFTSSYQLVAEFENGPKNNMDFRDINADGFMDFIAIEGSTAKVFVNDGTALPSTFTKKNLRSGSFSGVSFINTGADEAMDAVLSSNLSSSSHIWHYTNDGSENFTENQLLSGGSFGYMTHKVADIDGDGNEDILYTREFIYMYWLEGDGLSSNESPGTGGFTDHPYPDYFTSIISWCNQFEVVDIDKDGDMDFLAYDKNDTGYIYAFLNDGSEVFTQRLISASAPPEVYTLTYGDFNADNVLDILYGGTNGFNKLLGGSRLKWAEVEW